MARESLLRSALLANAAFSTLSAAAFTLVGGPIADWMHLPTMVGLPAAAWLWALAPGLAGFAAVIVWTATRRTVNLRSALLISLADLGWVLSSALLVTVVPLGWTAIYGVGMVAVIVALWGTLQVAGVLRIVRSWQERGEAQGMPTPT